MELSYDISYHFDGNLREVPHSLDEMRRAVSFLRETTRRPDLDQRERIRIYGLLGSCLRILNELDEAEKVLTAAYTLAETLGNQRLRVSSQLRLAHVQQWQGRFEGADRQFASLIDLCEANPDVSDYLDFVYQHAGKSKFDQQRYDEALRFFEKALAIRQQKGNVALIASTQHALAVTRQRLLS